MLNEGQIIVITSLIVIILFIYTFYYSITLPFEKNKK
jgi:preprotein translocase subunit YajC